MKFHPHAPRQGATSRPARQDGQGPSTSGGAEVWQDPHSPAATGTPPHLFLPPSLVRDPPILFRPHRLGTPPARELGAVPTVAKASSGQAFAQWPPCPLHLEEGWRRPGLWNDAEPPGQATRPYVTLAIHGEPRPVPCTCFPNSPTSWPGRRCSSLQGTRRGWVPLGLLAGGGQGWVRGDVHPARAPGAAPGQQGSTPSLTCNPFGLQEQEAPV